MTVSTEIATPSKSTKFRNLHFFGISRYKFKLRFLFNLNLYRGICVSGFGGFRGCSILSGNCHIPPLTEEIRLKIFGSPHLPHFRADF